MAKFSICGLRSKFSIGKTCKFQCSLPLTGLGWVRKFSHTRSWRMFYNPFSVAIITLNCNDCNIECGQQRFCGKAERAPLGVGRLWVVWSILVASIFSLLWVRWIPNTTWVTPASRSSSSAGSIARRYATNYKLESFGSLWFHLG